MNAVSSRSVVTLVLALLVFAITVSLLTGCGGGGGNSTPVVPADSESPVISNVRVTVAGIRRIDVEADITDNIGLQSYEATARGVMNGVPNNISALLAPSVEDASHYTGQIVLPYNSWGNAVEWTVCVTAYDGTNLATSDPRVVTIQP
ncbi:hypothetical protein LLG39_09605 [bacterium]|nr:hypothetical protein [bacterium]